MKGGIKRASPAVSAGSLLAVHDPPRSVGRIAFLAALGLAAVLAAPAPASLAAGVLAAVNRERAAAGAEPLKRSKMLERAALAKARLLATEVATVPSAEPAQITALAHLDDLSDHLGAAGFAPRRASAHVVVADQPLTPEDLVGGEPGLWADLLDPELRELGLGLVREGRLEILVAIVALSKEVDFALLTSGLKDIDLVRSELLELTNEARRERQRRPLRRDRCLERAAQRYADRMVEEGFYGHLSPRGRDVAFRVRGGGCPRSHVGENLARGQASAEQVVAGWLASPDHRDNLLNPNFRRVGFGLAFGRQAEDYWIVWVQVLSGN